MKHRMIFDLCAGRPVWVGTALTLALTFALATWARRAPAQQPSRADSAYLLVYSVLQSPRCRNCHPQGDAPLQGDDGKVHAMLVSRGSPNLGLPCTSCHRSQNGTKSGSPPGALDWRMPAADAPLVFENRSPRELCLQLKDPTRNGGRTGTALVEHMAHDPLVTWAWSPGPGRSVPKESQASVARATSIWVAEGMPCPL
jgi:hypothetical protein